MQKTKLSRLTMVIILVLSVFALIQIYNTNQKIEGAKAQELELTRQLKEIQSANAALKAQVQSANDPKTKENIARTRLGLILPGEIVYKEN
ncbi:MAG: septum formation initiator family protein [Oscillospiraceae bacterium]|nr:septum formation initiator family protein [Oscillospiraceae bacterium]